MAKSSTPSFTMLILCSHVFFMQTSASDTTLSSPNTAIMAQIGEELRITCLATKCSNKNPDFTWSSLVDNTLSGTVNTEGKTSTLTMKINAETDGSYRCTVSCDNPPVEKRFTITVYSFPSDPILDVSSLVVGERSLITCTFLNIYPIEMLSAEILVGNNVENTVDQINLVGLRNFSLTYELNLTEEMDGIEITCAAQLHVHTEPIQKQTIQNITLIYPPVTPNITVQPSTTVKAGEQILLLCSSESKSPVSIQWVKQVEEEELEISSEDQRTLKLSNAQPEDSGVYICHAENSAGKVFSKVEINVQGITEKPILSMQPGTTVEAGQAVTIECLVSSNTSVTLWKMSKDGNVLFQYSEEKVTISGADPIDATVYICRAENQYGVSETSEFLTVEYSPRETILSSSSVDVKKGDTVSLTCVSNGVPTPNISIYKLSTSGESVLLSEGPEIMLSDATSGIYQCQAENKLGTDQDNLELMVPVAPKNTFLTIKPSHTVKEGDSVQMRCTSEAVPAPTLVLMMETELGITELKTEEGHYSITQATVHNAGVYMCVSTNVIGQQNAEATLTVQVPPQNTHISIYPSSVVREGDNVQIKCMSEASPAPRLALKMKMEHDVVDLVSEGGEYNISNVGVRHIGTYICESTNAAGSEIAEGILNVEVPPMNTSIKITPSPVVIEGDSVKIWCISEGSPQPKLVLKMRREHELITLELIDGFYNITHAGVENAGTYICESNNMVGMEVALTTLTVHIPPRNTTVVVTPSQNIREGDTVTITCETHSIPSPTIILQKVCAENNTVLQSNNGTFTLYNVTRNDTGTYILNITNSAGNETEAFSLFVEERPEQSPRFNPTSVFIFGSVAFVSAGAIASVIYHLKKSKLQGSYSLVKALRSKV